MSPTKLVLGKPRETLGIDSDSDKELTKKLKDDEKILNESIGETDSTDNIDNSKVHEESESEIIEESPLIPFSDLENENTTEQIKNNESDNESSEGEYSDTVETAAEGIHEGSSPLFERSDDEL